MRTMWGLALGLLLTTATAGAEPTARVQLNAFTRDLTALSGQFEQHTRGDAAVETSTGQLAMAAPRRFRWDYEDPFEQRIVADGDHIWVYDIDLEQVSVRPQSFDESSSPLAILMDLSQIDIEFKVSAAPAAEGMAWLHLHPRGAEPQFKVAELGFRDDQLRIMRVRDNFDGVTEYRFSAWVRNPRLAADTFIFVPPEGVDVIGEQRDAALVTPIAD